MSKTVAVADADLPTLVEEVKKTREEIVITQDGMPVARMVPAVPRKPMTLEELRNSGRILGDIEEPILGSWDMEK